MRIINERISLATKGSGDFIDITQDVSRLLKASGVQTGNLLVFAIGSTAAIITLEYEPGLLADMNAFYEQIASSGRHYFHDDTWGDANGYSHLRASLAGQSLTVPFEKGKMLLGMWQQIAFVEFDNRPRERQIVVQIMGE